MMCYERSYYRSIKLSPCLVSNCHDIYICLEETFERSVEVNKRKGKIKRIQIRM